MFFDMKFQKRLFFIEEYFLKFYINTKIQTVK